MFVIDVLVVEPYPRTNTRPIACRSKRSNNPNGRGNWRPREMKFPRA